MTPRRNTGVLWLLSLFFLTAVRSAVALECGPPPGFVDIPHPALAPAEQLVSHTEEISVNRTISDLLDAAAKTNLKDEIRKGGSLPTVSGEYMLTRTPFGTPGTRRLVCLTDGSTLEEQVLEREQSEHAYHFRYIVWNYTTKQARPIEYGIGDFEYSDLGAGRTRIVWTYSFKLKENEFPGYLGALGRYLFRVTFLDRDYADMMRETLKGMKTRS
jgi:hypothetical protein